MRTRDGQHGEEVRPLSFFSWRSLTRGRREWFFLSARRKPRVAKDGTGKKKDRLGNMKDMKNLIPAGLSTARRARMQRAHWHTRARRGKKKDFLSLSLSLIAAAAMKKRPILIFCC